MALLDNIKNAFSFGDKNAENRKDMMREIGASGTSIWSGISSEEYLGDLQGQNGITVYNKMRCSDAMIMSGINAFKLTLLAAKDTISGENEEYNEFIEDALFTQLDQNWNSFKEEAFNFPIFGFYYFEKIYKELDNGKIVWDKFAPRIPSAHYKWHTKDRPFVEQQLSGDELGEGGSNPSIPFEKLLYFVFQKEGDNYDGRSILRPVRQAWLYKQKMMKIIAVACERYGVGVPVYGIKQANAADITLITQMLQQLRANEKSYIVKPNIEDTLEMFGGNSGADLVKEMIDYLNVLNRDIARAFMAMFLVSGDNSVGSMAKSQSEMDFFSNTIKHIGSVFSDELNKEIKNLIDINFSNVDPKDYPYHSFTDISKVDIEKFANTMNVMVQTGLVDPNEKNVNDFVRDTLDIPQKDESEILPQKETKIEDKKDDKKDDQTFSNKSKKKISLAEKSKKEKIFQKVINEQEKFLQTEFKKTFIPLIEETEEKIKTYLRSQYQKIKTEVVGGIEVIKKTGNLSLKNETTKGVKDLMSKFEDRLFSNKVMNGLHKTSMKNAISAIKEIDKNVMFATEIIVEESDFKSFIFGYKSNLQGVVFNEGRRIAEKINDNFTQSAPYLLATDQVSEIKFNRNIYKLSALSHPRGLFRRTVNIQAEKMGTQHYKLLVADDTKKQLTQYGQTALMLYSIKTFHDWNKQNGTKDNVNVVGGLGLHHGSQEYYLPIRQEELEMQMAIAEQQRRELEDEFDNME